MQANTSLTGLQMPIHRAGFACVFQVARSLGILDEVNRMKVVPGTSPSSRQTNKTPRSYMEVSTVNVDARLNWMFAFLSLVSSFIGLISSHPVPSREVVRGCQAYDPDSCDSCFPGFQNAASFKEIQNGEQPSSQSEWCGGAQNRYSSNRNSACLTRVVQVRA